MQKLVPFVLLSVVLAACSSGPSDSVMQADLKSSLPSFFEMTSFEVKDKENQGSKADPLFSGRVKARIKAAEATYTAEPTIPSFSFFAPSRNQTKVTYLQKKLSKGDETDIYGVVKATKYEDTWKFVFRLDNSITTLGQPKSAFDGTAFERGSDEEKKYKQAQVARLAEDKKATLLRVFGQETGGYMTGAFNNPFTLRFSNTQENSKTVSGSIIFPRGIIKGFTGSYSDDELKLVVNKMIQGSDTVGVGTEYNFRISELNPDSRRINGTYKHTDNRVGELLLNL